MHLEIQSTSDVMTVQGIPCRRWNILKLNGDIPQSPSFLFLRVLMVNASLLITDIDIFRCDAPPAVDDLSDELEELFKS